MIQIVAAALLLVANLSSAGSPKPTPIVAPAGEPVLVDDCGTVWGLPEKEYRDTAARLAAKNSYFVPIQRKPEGLSAEARFGWNVVAGPRNGGWAIAPGPDGELLLHADFNTNGDLTDEPPLRFTPEGEHRVARYRTAVRDERGESYPIDWKLVLERQTSPEPRIGLSICDDTIRRGVLRIGGRERAFALRGGAGIYDHDYLGVYFDLDGDGRYDPDLERYKVSEKYVTLGGASYEFIVDRYGRSMTLRPLGRKLPPRPSLKLGSLAPDFSYKDLNGKVRRLSSHRGKLVLIDFWSTHCGVCRADTPSLVDLYRKLHGRGFEILGVSQDDGLAELKEFMAQQGVSWPQTREGGDHRPLWDLFRVGGTPSYFLIGRDGRILATDRELRVRDEALAEWIEKSL
jgi:peroxiredoxin